MANWSMVTIEFPGITPEQWQALIDRIGTEPDESNGYQEWDMERLGGTAPEGEPWGSWVEEHYGAIVKECMVDHRTHTLYCRGRWNAAPDKFCDMLAEKLDIASIDMYWLAECEYDTTYYYRIRPAQGRFGVRHEYGSMANVCRDITREEPASWLTASMIGAHYFCPRHTTNVRHWYRCRLDDKGCIRDDLDEDNGECRDADDIPCEQCGKRMNLWLGYRYYPAERRLRAYGPALFCGWCDHYQLLDEGGKMMLAEDMAAQEQDSGDSRLFFCPGQLEPTCNITLREDGSIWIE